MDFSIANEVYILCFSVLTGMLISFLYDLFRTIRIEAKTGMFLSGIHDVLFWALATLIMFFLVFFTNDGRLRWYHIFGASLGSILYFLTMSKAIIFFVRQFIGIFLKIFELFLKILLTPLKFTYNILYGCLSFIISPVLRVFKRLAKKLYYSLLKNKKAFKTAFFKK
ncbi:MAG: spore cortex biosynthesis protein YabQ [Clostridia bacterium]|nr:spore cortex biosynthesis protein YabQ [Clostridia bacterium]